MQGANCKFANAGNANFPNLLPTSSSSNNNSNKTYNSNNNNNYNNNKLLPKYLATKKLNSKLA